MMFSPPQEIVASVFAAVPDELRIRDRTSAWAFGKHKPDLDCFIEGPCFDREGNLYITDIPFGRIFRVSPQGLFTVVAEYDGEPNGLAFHRDGRLFVADHRRGILVVDPDSGKVTSVLSRVRREGFKGVNDLTFAQNGDLYFTDQGQTGLHDPTGRLYRMRADGRVECLLDNIPSPNGLVLDRSERRLFLAVTRANQIWCVPLHDDGSTSKVSVFVYLQGGLTGPDGLALAQDGSLAIAHCGMGCAWIMNPLGEPLYRVRTAAPEAVDFRAGYPPGLSTTNLAFGWPDRTALYLTESDTGTIFRTELPSLAGQGLYSHS